MEKIVEKFELYGKEYRLETGELAKQTTGAVLVGQGDTTVLETTAFRRKRLRTHRNNKNKIVKELLEYENQAYNEIRSILGLEEHANTT